jgi:hypothetical protein
MRTTTIIIAALLSILSSCAAMEGKTTGRRAQLRAGVSTMEIGNFDARAIPTGSAEIEVLEVMEDTVVGVAAIDFAYGSSDDSFGVQSYALDSSRIGGRLGLRWRPGEGWGYKIMPVAGFGVGVVDAEIESTPSGGGFTSNARQRDGGGYLEGGIEFRLGKGSWGTVMYQYMDYNTVRVQAVLIGLGFSF